MSLDWVLLGLRLLTAFILYLFLGLAFYIIWRDLKRSETLASPPARPPHHLRVVAAGESTLVPGQTIPLQPETLLGRHQENTIVVSDDSASNRHARLWWDSEVWWLEDMGSRNGTWLNGLQLTKPAPLANGDVISLGNLRFRLELGPDNGAG